jgi:hypothetical protein
MAYDPKCNNLRCDACGKFISIKDWTTGVAMSRQITPDSHCSKEEYETFCRECWRKERKPS